MFVCSGQSRSGGRKRWKRQWNQEIQRGIKWGRKGRGYPNRTEFFLLVNFFLHLHASIYTNQVNITKMSFLRNASPSLNQCPEHLLTLSLKHPLLLSISLSLTSDICWLFLILWCVLDPKQDTVGVTCSSPNAAVCENTVWVSPLSPRARVQSCYNTRGQRD